MICHIHTSLPHYPTPCSTPFFPSLPLLLLPEPPHNRPHHPPKPINIQSTQHRITRHIRHGQPHRHGQSTRGVHGTPHIAIHPHRLIRPPAQPTARERRDQHRPVHGLRPRARLPRLVEEPVDIQKGRAELVQHEVQAVVVQERPLLQAACERGQFLRCKGKERLTNPSSDTANALPACATAPHPYAACSPALTPTSHKKYPVANACTKPVAPE